MLQVIPQLLLGLPNCSTWLTDGRSTVIYKTLAASLPDVGKFVAVPLLLYLRQGEQHIRDADGGQEVLKPGQLLYLPRDVYVVSDFVPAGGRPLEALLFFIDDGLMDRFLRSQRATPLPADEIPAAAEESARTLSAGPQVVAFMDALQQVYATGDGGSASAALLELKVLELLHLLSAQTDGRAWIDSLAAARRGPRSAIADTMLRYASHGLTVADYAALARRSVSSFGRDFRRLYGQTPLEWLTAQRLDAAQTALAQGSSVTEAGLAAGYSNVSHFIRAYKRRFGDTPKRAQQQAGGVRAG